MISSDHATIRAQSPTPKWSDSSQSSSPRHCNSLPVGNARGGSEEGSLVTLPDGDLSGSPLAGSTQVANNEWQEMA